MKVTNKTPDLKLAKKLNIVAGIVSFLVLLLIISMRRINIDLDLDLSFLPALNAIINSFVALLLLLAFYFIRNNKKENHRKAINLALLLSVLFLAFYVLYHITTPETRYCYMDWTRGLYFFFLISHIVLAAFVLPFILFTYIRAYTGQYTRHRKIARWVFPFWLYVAISGPVCYLMLRSCY